MSTSALPPPPPVLLAASSDSAYMTYPLHVDHTLFPLCQHLRSQSRWSPTLLSRCQSTNHHLPSKTWLRSRHSSEIHHRHLQVLPLSHPDPNSPGSTMSTVSREIHESGGEATAMSIDTRDFSSIHRMVAGTIVQYGR